MDDTATPAPSLISRWRRKLGKLYIRVIAQKGSPEFIARGVAIGLFIGLLIPMSGQLIIAVPLAWLLNASKLAAAIATFITNPWTVIVIYPIQIYFGKLLITASAPSWSDVEKVCSEFIEATGKVSIFEPSSFKTILTLSVDELILPFFVAGFVMGAVASIIGYMLSVSAVVRYRKMRDERRQRKKLKLQHQLHEETP